MFGLKTAISVLALVLVVGFEEIPAGEPVASTLSPQVALARLKEGNAHFQMHKNQHPHEDARSLMVTAEQGQHPFVSLLTCSDSRVPVELIFDQGVGDVFVIRVAGNVCGDDEMGSIEYGVDHLGTPLLVVLGHNHCGAVTAAVTGAHVQGHVVDLMKKIRPACEAAGKSHPALQGKDLLPAATEANVWESISDLLVHSPTARDLVIAGKLRIVGALYHLEDGRVDWLGEHPSQSRLLHPLPSPSSVAPHPNKP